MRVLLITVNQNRPNSDGDGFKRFEYAERNILVRLLFANHLNQTKMHLEYKNNLFL